MAAGSCLPKPSTSAAMYMVERSSQNESLLAYLGSHSSAQVVGGLGKARVS